ncbi:hypothetical protein F5Y11DRAFT_353387 [Daldinia sp. FL1419]|nr:hypothetical protein F5Y11DRAFT_353387 [Daldinia sp. FL1419]
MTPIAAPPAPSPDGSNWTAMYVILGLIPVTFIIVAIFSAWRDSRIAPRDIEMAALPSRRALALHEAVAISELGAGGFARPMNRARITITRPAPVSANAAGPAVADAKKQRPDERPRIGGINTQVGPDRPVVPPKDIPRIDAPENTRSIPKELENVPF